MFRRIRLRQAAPKDCHRCATDTQCRAMRLAINTARATRNDGNTLCGHSCRKARRLCAAIGRSASRTNYAHRVLRCSGGSPTRPQHDGRQWNRRQKWRVVSITKHHRARTDALHCFALSIRFHRPELRVHAFGSGQRYPLKAGQLRYRSRQHRLRRTETRQRGMMERRAALIREGQAENGIWNFVRRS